MSFFKKLLGIPAARFDAPLVPAAPIFVIGDLHGCARQMLEMQYLMKEKDPTAQQVYVGDYIDRGEHNKAVLIALSRLWKDPNVICLRGNHEDMLLQFLKAPAGRAARWIRYGGQKTLECFGVGVVTDSSHPSDLKETAAALKVAMGPGLIRWIETRPTWCQSGNLVVTHAGADPALSMEMQSDASLTWGHPEFEKIARTDGLWVAHGHTVVTEPFAKDGRIAVDTGAYTTGRLTAAYITPDGVEFLHVT